MKKIKKFVDEFIDLEYKCTKAKFDLSISHSQHKMQYEDKVTPFFHSILVNVDYGRGIRFDSFYDKEDCLRKMSKTRKRLLFQIKKFENPTLGFALNRIVKSNILYRFDVSYDQETPTEFSGISSGFYIIETDEGLKIIYDKSFNIRQNNKAKWTHPHKGTQLHVQKEGKLLEVLKIQEPIDPTSLLEYNKDFNKKGVKITYLKDLEE